MGGKMDVRLKDRSKAEGVLTGTSESGLTLVNKTKTISIERANIQRLYLVRGRSTSTAVAIAAGVGAGGGAVVGAAATRNDSWFRGPAILVIAAVGAIAGAVTGLIIGRTHNNRLLIYEAA
jgi:hypothetical protein